MLKDYPYEVVNGVPMTKFKGPNNSKLFLVHTMQEWEAFYKLLMSKKTVACDTETSGFNYFKEGIHIVGMSFGWTDTHFYVPVRHEDSVLGGKQVAQLDMDDIRDDLKAFFSDPSKTVVFHNIKFDWHFYREEGIDIKCMYHDSLILWKLFNENASARLKTIASGWKDIMGRSHKGLIGPEANENEKKLDKWRDQEAKARRKVFSKVVMEKADEMQTEPKFQQYKRADLKNFIKNHLLADHEYANAKKDDVHYGFVPIEMMTEYAATDTLITYAVYSYVLAAMEWTDALKKLYVNELKVTNMLLDIEETGIKIDRPYLIGLSAQYDRDIQGAALKAKEFFGDINLNSTQQLASAFLEKGITLTKKTETGNYSVDVSVLRELGEKHDEVSHISNIRLWSKLKNTYADSILDKLTEDDILHTSFNQNVDTGRMSSVKPNCQNIPGQTAAIRRAFVCPEDYLFYFFDYSQVEVRIAAHYSRDPILLEAYRTEQDVHTRTMCEMFGYEYDYAVDVLDKEDKTDPDFKHLKTLRNISKRINFGILYGVGAPGLSAQIPRPDQYLHCSEEEWVQVCQGFIDNYFDKYRSVKKFINKYKREVRYKGEVTSHFGRVRHLPHHRAFKLTNNLKYKFLEGKAERQGVNFIIQGTAADLFKMAAVRVHSLLEGKKSRIVNLVHDDVQTYIHKSELDLIPQIKEVMEDFDFAVPILVDVEKSEYSWAEKQTVRL